MDPLVVAGRVRERVDCLLADGDVLADAEFGSGAPEEIFDWDGCEHAGHATPAAGLHPRQRSEDLRMPLWAEHKVGSTI